MDPIPTWDDGEDAEVVYNILVDLIERVNLYDGSKADTAHGHDAGDIAFTPIGNLSAETVGAALAELDGEKLAKAGGTMTGPLFLAGDPTNDLHAASKGYVDALFGGIDDYVSGPASAVADRIALFDGATGKLIKDSGKALPSTDLVGEEDGGTHFKYKTIDAAFNTFQNIPFWALAPNTLDNDPTLSANSSERWPSQQAVKAYSDARLPLAGGTMTGAITLAADAASALQPVSKQQLEAALINMGKRTRVRAKTTGDVNLGGGLVAGATVDGVTVALGDLVLVASQSTTSQNGVYTVPTSGSAPRAAEFDSWDELPGSLVTVAEGSTQADSVWLCTSNAGGTLGSTAIAFSQLRVSGELLAANNLSDLASVDTALTNLGFSPLIKSLRDDTTTDAAQTTLGGTTVGKAVFTAASKLAARDAIGAAGPDFLSTPALAVELAAAADIVGAFIYDTRLDSNGGDWRRRCRHTSWYQETLNTATRGRRRDFPEVALIVLRSGATNTLSIYDVSDIDPATGKPRMWKIIPRGSTHGGWTPTTAVKALNGRVCVTADSGVTGEFYIYNFALDLASYHNEYGHVWPTLFSLDNSSLTSASPSFYNNTAGALASGRCLDFDLRILPGAPLDDAGLPIPTIAVATTAGVSVIHPNGLVADIARTGGCLKVRFLSDDRIVVVLGVNSAFEEIYPVPYADVSGPTSRVSSFGVAGNGADFQLAAIGGVVAAEPQAMAYFLTGVTFLDLDYAETSKSMLATATALYATGWLPGDTRRAWICGGTTGSLVAANPLNDTCASTTGWTLGSGWSHDSTEFDHAAAGGTAALDRALTGLTTGQRYAIVILVGNRTAGSVTCTLVSAADKDVEVATENGTYVVSFTAAATTDVLRFNPTTSFDGSIQDVQVYASVADRSYLGDDLLVVGTLSRAAVASGADLAAFSGFSVFNFLTQTYSADLDFVDADFAIPFWLKEAPNSVTEVIFERDSPSTAQRITLQISSAGILQFVTDDGADVVTCSSPAAIDDGIWHHVVALMRGNTMELWIDGFLVSTADATAVGTLTNTSALARVGVDCQSSPANPLTNGSVALFRLAATAPTPKQIRKMFADEVQLFRAGAKAFLGGISPAVAALSADPVTGQVAVATADGVSLFRGLSRVGYLDTAAVPALTSDNMKAVALRGPNLLLAGASNVAVYREETWAIDEAARAGRDQRAQPLVFRGVTTDATPSTLAPRLFVGEREMVRGRIRVVGRQYGAAATERFSTVLEFSAYRDAGGNVTLSIAADDQHGARWDTTGAAAIVTTVETTAGMDAAVVADTAAQTLGVQVTGKASTRIVWTAEVEGLVRISEDREYAA